MYKRQLLLSSLDISRRNLALRGREAFGQVIELADYARGEINDIGGYYAYSEELVNGDSIFAFDRTKLSVHTLDIGLAGIEVYDILRDEYDIQIEFGDLGNILAYLSIGDRMRDVERLVSALSEIKRRFAKDPSTHSTRKNAPFRWTKRRDTFAANSSCATRPASPSSHRGSGSRPRSSNTSAMPRKRAVR